MCILVPRWLRDLRSCIALVNKLVWSVACMWLAVCEVMWPLLLAGTGHLYVTWWHPCWTLWDQSSVYCCCFSFSSWSLPCLGCNCLAASSTLTTRRTNRGVTLTPSGNHCSLYSRSVIHQLPTVPLWCSLLVMYSSNVNNHQMLIT